MCNSNSRGVLTNDSLRNKLEQLELQHPITLIVRLLLYIDYVIKNCGRIDNLKITLEESDVIARMSEKNLIKMKDDCIISIDHDFFLLIQDVLFDSYVCKK